MLKTITYFFRSLWLIESSSDQYFGSRHPVNMNSWEWINESEKFKRNRFRSHLNTVSAEQVRTVFRVWEKLLVKLKGCGLLLKNRPILIILYIVWLSNAINAWYVQYSDTKTQWKNVLLPMPQVCVCVYVVVNVQVSWGRTQTVHQSVAYLLAMAPWWPSTHH